MNKPVYCFVYDLSCERVSLKKYNYGVHNRTLYVYLLKANFGVGGYKWMELPLQEEMFLPQSFTCDCKFYLIRQNFNSKHKNEKPHWVDKLKIYSVSNVLDKSVEKKCVVDRVEEEMKWN